VADDLDIDLVLITGAGASRTFGVNQTQLPLMGEWSDHLVRKLGEQPGGYLAATKLEKGLGGEEFERRLGGFLRSVNAFKGVGDLLGPLTSIQGGVRPQGNEGDWRQWHDALSFQLDQIVKVIYETLYEMFGAPRFDPGLAQGTYGRLLSTIGISESSRWVYATTNYDTIGETAISLNGGLPDVGEVQTPPGVSELPIRVDGLLGGMPRYIPVLHLHGRVGWFRRPGVGLRSVPVERYSADIGTPVAMLPDLDKTYDGDPTIESLWREFASALARAKRVLVLGHSLHDRALIRTMREAVEAETRIAVTVYENPEEPTDAADVKARVEADLPNARLIPFRFEANRDFISEPLRSWLTSTGGTVRD
jgi:hypothetical protein